jgi:hypothetical protein
MVLGLSIAALTIIHVIISLVAIASGLIVLAGMFGSHRFPGWTAFFLAMTILTSVTGFLFPIKSFTPALGTGAVSMVLLAFALLALYRNHLSGTWRGIYVVMAVAALYVNVFVLIVQAFLKVPALHAMAPNGNESPFVIAQGVALVVFVILGFMAANRFRPVLNLQS